MAHPRDDVNDDVSIPQSDYSKLHAIIEKLSSGFPTERGSNQSPQLERLARKLKTCLQ